MTPTTSNISIKAERVNIRRVEPGDADFLMELMNSEGWITFIGDRNVPTLEAASNYIRGIVNNPFINYLVVTHNEIKVPMGIVSLIKREYLEHWDIGFAFLPRFNGQGYAYEATEALIDAIKFEKEFNTLLATTKKDNTRSVRLLEKLGFHFNKQIEWQSEILQLYSTRCN